MWKSVVSVASYVGVAAAAFAIGVSRPTTQPPEPETKAVLTGDPKAAVVKGPDCTVTHVIRDLVPVWERPRITQPGEVEVKVVLTIEGSQWDVRFTVPQPAP